MLKVRADCLSIGNTIERWFCVIRFRQCKCRGFLAQCLNRQNGHESLGSMRITGDDEAYSITRDRKTSIETSIVTLSHP